MVKLKNNSKSNEAKLEEPVIHNLNLVEILVLSSGAIILLAGFISAWKLLATTWKLFTDHNMIAILATEVEKHSKLNATVLAVAKPLLTSNPSDLEAVAQIDLAYFAAWILAVLLLGLLGHLTSLLIVSGARLISISKPSKEHITRSELKVILKDLAQQIKSQ